MIEITMALGRAEQLREVLGAGISMVMVIREAMDDSNHCDALHGAMMVLQQAYGIVDDMIEGALHE